MIEIWTTISIVCECKFSGTLDLPLMPSWLSTGARWRPTYSYSLLNPLPVTFPYLYLTLAITLIMPLFMHLSFSWPLSLVYLFFQISPSLQPEYCGEAFMAWHGTDSTLCRSTNQTTRMRPRPQPGLGDKLVAGSAFCTDWGIDRVSINESGWDKYRSCEQIGDILRVTYVCSC